MIHDAAWPHDRSPGESAHLNAWTLDLTALRSGGELRFDLSRAQLIVAESIASGPLPDAKIIDVVVVGNGDSIPQLHLTLRLGVDFIMASALPGDLDSTTITRTQSVSILG